MKKAKLSVCLAAAIVACVCGGCAPQEQKEENTVSWETQTAGKILTRPRTENESVYEILPDRNFSQGFNVSKFHSNSSHGQFAGVLEHGGDAADGAPCWQLSQWGCSHDLAQADLQRQGSVLCYSDGGKSVRFDASKAGSFTLAIQGSEEYTKDEDGNVRERTDVRENWPHLLMEQVGVNHTISARAKELVMTLDYEVTKCVSLVDRTRYPENPDLNAAQFQWFLNLTDVDPASESFHHSMWFGFSMFDTRSLGATPGGMSAYDGGKEDSTGLFIYMFSLEKAARGQRRQPSLVGRRGQAFGKNQRAAALADGAVGGKKERRFKGRERGQAAHQFDQRGVGAARELRCGSRDRELEFI